MASGVGCSSNSPEVADSGTAPSPAVSTKTTDNPLSAKQKPLGGTFDNPIVDGTPLSQKPVTGGGTYVQMLPGPFDPNIKENVQESVERTVVDPRNLPQIDPATQKFSQDEAGRTVLETTHRESATGKVVIAAIRLTPLGGEKTTHVFGVLEVKNQSLYPATDLQVVFFDGDLPTVLMSNRTIENDNPTYASPLAPGETRKFDINTVCQLKHDGISHNNRLGLEAQLAGPPGLSIEDTEVRFAQYNAATGNEINPPRVFNGRNFPGPNAPRF